MIIRELIPEDIPYITEIYKFHVLYGTGSFELTPPNEEEMFQRWKKNN